MPPTPSPFPLLLAALLLVPGQVRGQRRPEPPTAATGAAPVELSPFLVDATRDIGYQAGNTTSGSRLNTSLRDTAATLQVFTPEFLQDLGANSLAEVLAYGTSVQPDLGDTSPESLELRQALGEGQLVGRRVEHQAPAAGEVRDQLELVALGVQGLVILAGAIESRPEDRARPDTPGPVSAMVPDISWPMMHGVWTRRSIAPWKMCTSVPQMPAYATSIRTSFGPGVTAVPGPTVKVRFPV